MAVFPFHSSRGVLGLNARNLLYIKPFNPRKAVALADDKLKTKAFLAARGIPVAKIYGRIEDHQQLRNFDFSQLPDQCVLKPNYGFGGEGILVLKGRRNGEFLEGKKPVPEKQMREHIEDILDGKFSVNGMPDTAFFEKILVADEAFAPFRPAGLPDIRIVVFNLVPVMAMIRIPTVESRGKANVHLGGIGVGIDIAKGVTTHATQYNRIVHELPHGGSPAGIVIPGWDELLLVASKIQYVTNIGYLAVDLTIDAEQGPVLLEVNARAGLMVQVANLAPLRARLERVGGLSVSTPEKGVRLAQDLFGAKVVSRKAIQEPGRPILGTRETISISGDGATLEVPALIASDVERTIFAPELIQELQRADATEVIETEEGEKAFRVKFSLGGRKIQTVVRSGPVTPASVRAIIGRRDLTGFLIDPSKTADAALVRPTVKEDLRAIDKFLSQADEDLLLLKFVKPENLQEEWHRAEEDPYYNPIFHYAPIGINLEEVEERLIALSLDDSAPGILFKKKRRELLQRISLLKNRGNARRFTEASSALYGVPTSVLLTAASSALRNRIACDIRPRPADMLTADKVAPMFEEVLTKYGLHDWSVAIRDNLVARCTVGGQKIYLRRDARFSPANIQALIAHEIETHVLTAENGDHQPFGLFRRGFANYLDTQEGLAIYSQNRVLPPYHDKRHGPERNILAVAFAMEHSFAETRKYLVEELGYDQSKALNKTIDIKRGLTNTEEPGGFTKGVVYYRGLRAIEQYLMQGGDLIKLFIGKIALEDLDLIAQIPNVKPALVIPAWLRGPLPEKKTVKKAKKK